MPIKLPDGTAEFIMFIAGVLFLVYLWYVDKFRIKNPDTKEDRASNPEIKQVSQCALADEKLKTIIAKTEEALRERIALEERIISMRSESNEIIKMLMITLQENTKANTLLAERIRQ